MPTPKWLLATTIFALAFECPDPASAAESSDDAATTVVLVRHAEKVPDGSRNPQLTEAGLARAQALVEALTRAHLAAVYSTDLCRTATTADPVALAHGLPIRVQRIAAPEGDGLSDCTPPVRSTLQPLALDVESTADLSRHIREQHPGEVVLVVGHSNTLPEIVAALLRGADTAPELTVPDDDYDDLLIVELPVSGPGSLVHASYGPR